MINRIAKDSITYGITGIMTRGFPLIMIPFYTRLLSPEDYGVIDLLVIFAAIVNFTVALEISQGLARHYADAETLSDKSGYASSALWFVVAAYGIFALIAVPNSEIFSMLLLGDSRWSSIFNAAVIAMCCNGLYFLLQDFLRWQLKPKSYGIASLAYTILTTGTAASLILIVKVGVIGIYYGQIVGAILGSLLSWLLSRDLYHFHFDFDKCRQMISFSAPLVPSSIAVFFSFYVDRLCIKHFMTLTDVGIYGIGFRFASIISLMVIGVRGSLMPLVYKNYQDPDTPLQIEKIFRYFMVFTLLLYTILSIYSPEIIYWFTTPAFYDGYKVMPILGISILLGSIYFFAPGLAIAKKTRTIAAINILSTLLNIVLNLILIPLWGIVGAAVATCLASFSSFTVRMIYSQKFYNVPHMWVRYSISFIICVISVSAGLAIITIAYPPLPISVMLKTAIITVTAIILALLLLKYEEIASMIKFVPGKLGLIKHAGVKS